MLGCVNEHALGDADVLYTVAPYEADAQLSHMSKTEEVYAVLTEDGDLTIPYRCKRVLRKWDRATNKVQRTGWPMVERGIDKTVFRDIGNAENPKGHLVDTILLSGSDYLPSLRGIGLTTAVKLIAEHKNPQLVSQ